MGVLINQLGVKIDISEEVMMAAQRTRKSAACPDGVLVN
jgi:hypothetical protein